MAVADTVFALRRADAPHSSLDLIKGVVIIQISA